MRCILETTTGSNHFLIQLQAVGKKGGAPMIWVGAGCSNEEKR